MASKSKKTAAPVALPDSPKQTLSDLKEEYEMLRAAHCLMRAAFGIIAMRSSGIGEDAAKTFTTCFDDALRYLRDNAHSIARDVKELESSKSYS